MPRHVKNSDLISFGGMNAYTFGSSCTEYSDARHFLSEARLVSTDTSESARIRTLHAYRKKKIVSYEHEAIRQPVKSASVPSLRIHKIKRMQLHRWDRTHAKNVKNKPWNSVRGDAINAFRAARKFLQVTEVRKHGNVNLMKGINLVFHEIAVTFDVPKREQSYQSNSKILGWIIRRLAQNKDILKHTETASTLGLWCSYCYPPTFALQSFTKILHVTLRAVLR